MIFIVILLSAAVLISGVYISTLRPDYNEKISLKALNEEVEVYYDDFAIPHIYAKSPIDAFHTLGYVHAKERLWQMEILRRVGSGRLSEVFGERTLETDKFFRALSIRNNSEKGVRSFEQDVPLEVRQKVLAYVAGVNEFIDNGDTPLEYTILGIDKSSYTLTDIYDIMGYMAFSFAMAHKSEPILTYVAETLGEDYLKDLDVHVDPLSTIIQSGRGNKSTYELSLHIHEVMDFIPASPFIGSNSWVLSPEKTSSGQVILANDPHMGFTQPAVWFEAHLEAPGLSVYGNFVGGMPFPYIGHNKHHAIGLTMFENDDIDLFREQVNPQNALQYWHDNQWKNFDVRKETIAVKGGDQVELEIKSGIHGPVISEVTKGMNAEEMISMWWVYYQFPNRGLEATHNLLQVESLEEAQYAASLIHAPGLNVMYGDVEGNIAWWAAAKLPRRPQHVNSKLILDGSGKDDPLGFYDFSDNPQAINPSWGYVYSANNQSVKDSNVLHPGYYLPEDRARRIVKLLEQEKKWTVDEVKEMMLDTKSENAPEIVDLILSNTSEDDLSEVARKLTNILKKWDGTFAPDQIAPIAYHKFVYKILEHGMKDELKEYFDAFNGTHVMKRSIQPLLGNIHSVWWDNVDTEDKETISQIFTAAIEDGTAELTEQLGVDPENWQWSDVHPLEHNHSMGANPALRPFFNVGPFGVGGTTEVINNLQFNLSPDGIYNIKAGPSCRRIVDFSDVENNSWSISPTGQSGNPMSPHYADQAQMYTAGKFRKKLMNEEDIKSSFRYFTAFLPGSD